MLPARPDLTLRQASRDDIDMLARFSDALNDEDGHPLQVPARDVLETLLADKRLGAAFIVERDGAVVGSVLMCFGFSVEYGGRDAIVDEIYILPDARGGGIGGWVLQAMEAWAAEHGLVALHLEVMRDNPAATLYARHGYAGRDSLLLSKRLDGEGAR